MLREEHGQGEPFVLIHGLGASHSVWRHAAPLLATDRRVLTVDVPGFGSAPAIAEGFDLEAVGAALWSELPKGVPLTLVGHSMGGAIALVMASLEPSRTKRLVLCATAGLRPLPRRAAPAIGWAGDAGTRLRHRAAGLARTAAGRRLLLGASISGTSRFDQDEVAAIVATSGSATRTGAALAAVVSADLRPRLAELPSSVALICGADDRVIPPAPTIATVRELRPDAAIARVPGTGHIPMLERPHAFAAVVRQVVREADQAAEVHRSTTSDASEDATVQANARRGV